MPKTVTKASSSSRASYQKGYQLGNRGTASPKGTGPMAAGASVKGEPPVKVSSGRTGGRPKKLGAEEGGGGINVSYGETLPIGELQEVADFGKGTKAGKALTLDKPRSYAKEKGDKGSGFNYRKRR